MLCARVGVRVRGKHARKHHAGGHDRAELVFHQISFRGSTAAGSTARASAALGLYAGSDSHRRCSWRTNEPRGRAVVAAPTKSAIGMRSQALMGGRIAAMLD